MKDNMACRSSLMSSCVTHNYDPDGVFLGNICSLPLLEAEAVLQRIRQSGRRRIRSNYLAKRHRTEDWLTRRRQTLLGKTPLERPIYFFLGDFADGRDPSRPRSLVMPLSAFPSDTITFTYPDSMTSFSSRSDENRMYPYGEVFAFDQIVSVIDELGLPGDREVQAPLAHFERYLEMQAWDDRPILAFLASGKSDEVTALLP